MLSPTCTDVISQCTEYPPQYWSYPTTVLVLSPLHWTTSTLLKVSLYSTETLHSTDVIPTVLMLSPACTDVIPHYTEQPPQYWSYPPQYWRYSPLYWGTSVVLKLSPHSTEAIPHLLSNIHSTEAISHSTEAIPPVLMLSPDVLNNLQCTEQPPQYWTDVIWGGKFDSQGKKLKKSELTLIGLGGGGALPPAPGKQLQRLN